MEKTNHPSTIDKYILNYSEEVQSKLKELRAFINKLAPKAEESITYKIPTFKLNGKRLIYFAAFKDHISLYPYPSGEKEFSELNKSFKTSTGTIQFPINEAIPYSIVEKIVRYRIKECEKIS